MKNINTTELQLFNALHESRVKANEVFNQRAFRGVKPNVVDKYAETAHFIYELLQNADDAEASEVNIVLKKDKLLFKHNGTKHFDITSEEDDKVGDINSITGIGNSSKENTQNKIGKFGVGFKAVFQYTDTPEIYDDPFKFKIEDLIVPTLIANDYDERKDGETLFVLPFRDPQKSFQEIKKRLESLKNPILFLRHLKKITWRIKTGKSNNDTFAHYSKELLEKQSFDDVTLEKYHLTNALREDYMLLFSRDVEITTADRQKLLLPIYIGFYYDEANKNLMTKGTQNIYCFFPTKESFNSCFLAHAPFLLTENRQNIKRDENLNSDLIKCLASLAADSIIALRDYGKKKNNLLIDENIVDIFPQYDLGYYDTEESFFEQPIEDAFKEILENEKLLLSRNGKYLSIEDAYISINAMLELLSQQQFVQLRKNSKKYDFDDDEISDNIDFLKWELIMKLSKTDDDSNYYYDIKEYTIEDFGEDISDVFMKAQKKEWVTKFYTFLRNDAPKFWKISPQTRLTAHVFRHAPIIKIQSGEWVPPFIDTTTPNVFLPIETDARKRTGYSFINEEYLKEEMALKFFNELELKQPNEYDYIRKIILERYDEDEDNNLEVDNDLLKTDFHLFLSYYKKIKDTDAENEYIEFLKDKLYLVGTDDTLHKAESLYIENDILSNFLDVRGIYFDTNFYRKNIADFKESLVNDFVVKLGAKDKPTVESIRITNQFKLSQHILNTVNSISYYEFNHVDDYVLFGFERAYKNGRISKAISVYLWNNIVPFYFDKTQATIFTRQKRKQYLNFHYTESTFLFQLKNFSWIYDKDGDTNAPENLFVEDLASEYITYNGVAEFLGIEKRTQNLQEKYGVTEEEQQTYEMGSKIAQELDDDFSQEEALAAIKAAKEKKKQEKLRREIELQAKENSSSETNNSDAEEPQDINERLKKRWEEKSNRRVNKPHSSSKNGDELMFDDVIPSNNESPENNAPFFVPVADNQPTSISDDEDTSRAEKNLKAKDTSAQTQAEVAKEQVEILDLLKETPIYTFKWFKVLMELMHAGQQSLSERRVQIDFSRFETICSDKVLHLSEPSLPVPSWVCDAEKYSVNILAEGKSSKLDGLIVKSTDDSLDLSIEMDNYLLPALNKAKKIRLIALDNTNIINSLETRFLQLDMEDDFDMNANLPKNLSFIYGPPGTGKTTELVKHVHDLLENEPKSKILVLTPTNKAADVVALKMSNDEICEGGLARYGATESLYLIEDIGCVTNRDTTDMDGWHNIVVATAARYAYDFVQPDDMAICDFPWDYIFIDEASMIDILTITYVLYKGASAKKIIISGDPKQIQPVVNNDMPAYNIYDMVNLHDFSDAIYNYDRYPVQGLMTQHRSIPSIGKLVSDFAYSGLVDFDKNREPQKPLKLDGINIRDINFVGFDVVDMDDIRGLNSVNQSAFNLYSVLFTYNMMEYTIKQIEKNFPNQEYSIGAVCAYRAQSDALKNMLENRPLDTQLCSVSCGTVHSFQGDECDIMFIILNPPAVCTSGTHVNNENIINVAMSRARDYIFFILPNGQQKGFYMKNRLGSAVSATDRSILNSKDIENVMFNGDDNYICRNTHVTCHMPVNVYCEDSALYEVRYSDTAIDIKINHR